MAKKQIGRPPSYDEQQVQRALFEVALAGGNKAEASRRLKKADDPLDVPPSTLKLWCSHRHAAEYDRIRNEVQGQVRSFLAIAAEDNARKAAELEADMMERLRKMVKAGEVGDLATMARAVREMATTYGISTDKALVLRGQPSEITEHRTGAEILDSIQRMNPRFVLNEAESDITDADVVTDPEPPALAA